MKGLIILALTALFLTINATVLFEDRAKRDGFINTADPNSKWVDALINGGMTYGSKEGSVWDFKPVQRVFDYGPFGGLSSEIWWGVAPKIAGINVGANQKMTYKYSAIFEAERLDKHPFGSLVSNQEDDPRLGTCVVAALGPNAAFCTAHTNGKVWRWLEVFKYPGNPATNSTGFVNWKVGKNIKKGSKVDVKVVYNRKVGNIKYYAREDDENNWTEIGSINNPGQFPPSDGGATVMKFPDSATPVNVPIAMPNLNLMIACLAETDKSDPFDSTSTVGLVNHGTPESMISHPTSFFSPYSNSANDAHIAHFGQGIKFVISDVSIEVEDA